mmetsp:Transcript_5364/g.22722  ORF Transcript_5364/g.22722 Transcript_5364/m.22722 type:complete len:284 (+) Transcript_5364:201-1052(+)
MSRSTGSCSTRVARSPIWWSSMAKGRQALCSPNGFAAPRARIRLSRCRQARAPPWCWRWTRSQFPTKASSSATRSRPQPTTQSWTAKSDPAPAPGAVEAALAHTGRSAPGSAAVACSSAPGLSSWSPRTAAWTAPTPKTVRRSVCATTSHARPPRRARPATPTARWAPGRSGVVASRSSRPAGPAPDRALATSRRRRAAPERTALPCWRRRTAPCPAPATTTTTTTPHPPKNSTSLTGRASLRLWRCWPGRASFGWATLQAQGPLRDFAALGSWGRPRERLWS